MWICAIGYSDSSCQLTSTLGAPNDIGGAVYNLLVSVSAEGGLVSLHARVAPALPGLPGSIQAIIWESTPIPIPSILEILMCFVLCFLRVLFLKAYLPLIHSLSDIVTTTLWQISDIMTTCRLWFGFLMYNKSYHLGRLVTNIGYCDCFGHVLR